MKIIINPDFIDLKDFVLNLPSFFEKEGKTIYKGRNELKVFEVNGIEVNVKKYRIPIFINQFAYSFIRKSKAERAYKNALEVISRGFDTPAPIAYIEEKKWGLLHESYFICLQCPYTRMFREFADDADITGKEHIIKALGRYAAKMHEKGIYHLDFSVGNILFEDTPAGTAFSIVDLNRMKVCEVNLAFGCKNFERLRGKKEFFEILAKAYAKERKFDEAKCVELTLKYNAEHVDKFRKHQEFKKKLRGK
jgi:tRNA A-37 threonylcarbamoyl transferase component Bud32